MLSRLHFAREASHNLVSLAMKKRNTQQVQNVSGLIICSRAYVHAADVYYSPAIALLEGCSSNFECLAWYTWIRITDKNKVQILS